MVYRVVVFLVAVATSLSAFAQSQPQRTFGFWLKGQALLFGNFFQAPDGTPEDDVLAGLGEVGANLNLSNDLRAYASYNYLAYDDEQLDKSDGFRVGLQREGTPHAFNVYAEQLRDRPTFDVGDVFDRADITTLAGEYSYRFLKDWQASVDGEMQQQDFELTPARENDFHAIGGAIRWRGSRLFSPEIGFRTGERDVNDETLSYEQDDLYLQIRSAVTPDLYVSVRFRDRSRDYPNIGREDERRQFVASADWSTSRSLTWNFYYSYETVDVNIPDRDFDTSLLAAGLTWRF